MRDSYINAMNIQKTTVHWMNAISENLVNLYTPGYRENQVTFKTYLDAAVPEKILDKVKLFLVHLQKTYILKVMDFLF